MRRHGPRLGRWLILAGALAMRPEVIRGADPTRQAFTRAKRSEEVRARLGSPLRLGWNVDGSIAMGTNVDDVDVPPHLHARVLLLGPKGRGELTIVGRDDDDGDAWTLQSVGVELEDGDRIDLVGSPPPPEKPWWIPPDYAVFFVGLFVAFSALIGLVLGILSYRISARRAVARADVTAGATFELRLRSASRKHQVQLAFEVDHRGYEYDEGLTGRLEFHAVGHAPAHIKHRIGDRAPAIGTEFTRSTARADVAITSSGDRCTTSATVKLASIGRTDGDEVVAGSVVLAEGATARRLFVCLVRG